MTCGHWLRSSYARPVSADELARQQRTVSGLTVEVLAADGLTHLYDSLAAAHAEHLGNPATPRTVSHEPHREDHDH